MKLSIFALVMIIAGAASSFAQTGGCTPQHPLKRLGRIAGSKSGDQKVLIATAAAASADVATVGGEQCQVRDGGCIRHPFPPRKPKKPVRFTIFGAGQMASAQESFGTLNLGEDRLRYGLPPSVDQPGFPAEGGSGTARKKAVRK